MLCLLLQMRFYLIILLFGYALSCLSHQDSTADYRFVYEPDKEAKEAVGKILQYTGLSPNFTITSGKVATAMAYIKGWKRYIAYNPDFIFRIRNATRTDWAAVSVLAHEIGHHLSGHTLKNKKTSTRFLEFN